MKTMSTLLAEQPLLKDLDGDHLEFIAGCGRNVHFQEGEFLFREGSEVTQIFLVREGRVGIQIHVPGRGQVTLDAVGPGEIVGWSGFVQPHRARMDAVALDSVRAVALDAACLRSKCEADARLGYAMLRRVVEVLESRLQAVRVQLLDIYGSNS